MILLALWQPHSFHYKIEINQLKYWTAKLAETSQTNPCNFEGPSHFIWCQAILHSGKLTTLIIHSPWMSLKSTQKSTQNSLNQLASIYRMQFLGFRSKWCQLECFPSCASYKWNHFNACFSLAICLIRFYSLRTLKELFSQINQPPARAPTNTNTAASHALTSQWNHYNLLQM